ncbi:MAG: hypothetical protein ACD_22C00092G0001 [uncultured bacterium]|nr:MAG: hypothetical protein ACD_22C00092G0001 [uncultured bacterium]
MLNIPTDFNQKLSAKNPLSEAPTKRKPIMNYIVSLFCQFDFNIWESEENIALVRINKSTVENAEEFLKNVITILNKNIDASKAQKIASTKLNEIIKEIVRDFKYDLKPSEGFVDAVQLEDVWNYKEVVIETDSEFIYIQCHTTA